MQKAMGDGPIRSHSGWLPNTGGGRASGFTCQCCGKFLTGTKASSYLAAQEASGGPTASLPRHACEAVVYKVASPRSERSGEQLGHWAFYQREYAPIQRGVLWVPTYGYEETTRQLDALVNKYQGSLGATVQPEQWWLFGDKARLKPQARKWPLEDPVPHLQGRLAEAIFEFWRIGWMPVSGETVAND